MSSKLGIRIMLARKEMKMSQENLAKALGKSRQAIYTWESGEVTPSLNDLHKIAKITNKELAFFYETNTDLFAPNNTIKTAGTVKDADSWQNALSNDFRLAFPLIGVIKNNDVLFLDDSHIPGLHIGAPESFALQVKDDNMSPDFEKGDTLEIQTTSELEGKFNNKYFIIKFASEIYAAKCSKQADRIYITTKKNTKNVLLKDVKILGRVVARKIHL